MRFVDTIMARPGYFAAVGAVSIGLGVGAYFLSGKIEEAIRKRNGCESESVEQDSDIREDPREKVVYEKTISEEFVKPPIIDYTAYSKASVPEDEEKEEKKGPNSRIITMDEYMDASGKYGKADGTYFVKDGILAGWNENLDEKDPADSIGEEAVGMFSDPETKAVYVRNEDLMIDFEIVRSDDSYTDALAETEPE